MTGLTHRASCSFTGNQLVEHSYFQFFEVHHNFLSYIHRFAVMVTSLRNETSYPYLKK
jgi:hypothetical protein